MTNYEKEQAKKIEEWKNPPKTWLGTALTTIYYPVKKAGEVVGAIPGVNWVVQNAIGGVVSTLNDVAHWSVSPETVYQDFRNKGHDVHTSNDIFKLDLEQVDSLVGYIGAKYKSITFAEGAAAGYTGIIGLVPDIIALITLNQRAIAEYATYFGFDINSQQERIFALNILSHASSPDDASKQVAMAQLIKIAKQIAQKKSWDELNKHGFVKLLQKIAEALSVRLTKQKLAQIIPVTGAVVGGGFNAYYTGKVCDTAFYLYRERFLSEKYPTDFTFGQ